MYIDLKLATKTYCTALWCYTASEAGIAQQAALVDFHAEGTYTFMQKVYSQVCTPLQVNQVQGLHSLQATAGLAQTQNSSMSWNH